MSNDIWHQKPSKFDQTLHLINCKWWRVIKRISPYRYYAHYASDPDDPTAVDDLLVYETGYWIKRANKLNLSISDIPLDGIESHWERAYDGSDHVNWNSLRKLKKLIADAQHESKRRRREGHELILKYFTAAAALIAALASVAGLMLK